MAATAAEVVPLLLFLVFTFSGVGAATWCVVRSDASEQTLQTALDYACAAGADCAPIQSSGLCYLPNTLQAHASYAFNSFYQRLAKAPGSCSFSGAATIATTDPSYGSCIYPSSRGNAGGTGTVGGTSGSTRTPSTTPTITEPPPPPPPGTTTPQYGGGVGPNTGMGPVNPDTPGSNAPLHVSIRTICSSATFLLVFLFIFQII